MYQLNEYEVRKIERELTLARVERLSRLGFWDGQRPGVAVRLRGAVARRRTTAACAEPRDPMPLLHHDLPADATAR